MLSLHAAHQVKRWFPYGEGNRQCIGMPLARVNVQASVASLLSTFKFELADEVSHGCLTTDNQAHCRVFK
jgi:cytochrome P450